MLRKYYLLVIVLLCAITQCFSQCFIDNFSADYGNWSNQSGTYRNTTAGLTNSGIGFNSTGDEIISNTTVTNPQNLTLWLARTSSTANRTLSIQYSLNNTGPWVTARDILVGEVTTTHQEFTANLNLTGDYYLRIAMTQRTGGTYYVDDVTVNCSSCVPAHTIINFTPISGPELTHVTINGSGFSSGSLVAFEGVTSSNITFIDSSTIIAEVPLGTTTGKITITESSCDFSSVSDFTLLSGNCSSGGITGNFTDLLISGVYDDQTESCHYIELLNPTALDINLSTYSLGIDNNFALGSPVPTSGFNLNMPLTGTILAGDTTMIRLSSSGACTSCSTITPDLSFTGGGLNDEDRIVLLNGTTAQDVWQNHTTLGIGFNLGYVFTRLNTANGPSTTFNLTDWNYDGNEDCFGFTIAITPSPTVDMQPVDIDNCNSISINITVTAGNAGALTYQWKYTNSANVGWTNVTSATFSPGMVTGETSENLAITGFNLDGYQFYCQVTEAGLCDIATDAIQITMKNTVWNGASWSNGNPDLTTLTEINGNYNTLTHGSFSACSIIINDAFRVTIEDNTYIEIENNTVVAGELFVETKGSFIQNSDSSTFTNNTGISKVTKMCAPVNDWLEYTFWSSPVVGETIGNALFPSDANRRYTFNAQNYRDSGAETNNDNVLVNGMFDDEDDNGNDWQLANASDNMLPGIGYAATLSTTSFSAPGNQVAHTFSGAFNNGILPVTVYRNDTETGDKNWNFIGNPYPSAISIADFLTENTFDTTTNPSGALNGVLYFWSHQNPANENNNGNSQNNFSQSDYAIVNGTGGTAGGDNNGDGVVDMADAPNVFIPSGQGFFVEFSNMATSVNPNNTSEGIVSEATVNFRNSMRETGNNNQFFKSIQPNSNNKLWLYLSSNTGVSSQILIGYINGATNANDGAYFDATRNRSVGNQTFLYSTIENNNDNFAIQGKAPESLTLDEVIPLGLYTTIDNPTIYSISVSHIEGNFLSNNNIYLKDNYTGVIHDLNASDYNFTSASGEFRDRFEIVFNASSLSVNDFNIDATNLTIVELQDDNVQFSLSGNVRIQSIKIIDVLGRELYDFRGSENTEIYNLSKLSSAPYIVQITLDNGKVIAKKAIKK